MKLTKYVHSCLVIEDDSGRVGLFDPGVFSWQSGLFNLDSLTRLDDILITHEHEDHLYLPFISALVKKFPQAAITTTKSAAAKLQQAGFQHIQTSGSDGIELFAANHEPLDPLGPTPENIGIHYLGKLSQPGDSHHFSKTKQILALPVTAPWGSVTRAAELAVELKPGYVIPIHDWHWNAAALNQTYDRLEAFFRTQGITFIKVKDGVTITV